MLVRLMNGLMETKLRHQCTVMNLQNHCDIVQMERWHRAQGRHGQFP